MHMKKWYFGGIIKPNSCPSQGNIFYVYEKVMIIYVFAKKLVQFDRYTCQASPHKFVGSLKWKRPSKCVYLTHSG